MCYTVVNANNWVYTTAHTVFQIDDAVHTYVSVCVNFQYNDFDEPLIAYAMWIFANSIKVLVMHRVSYYSDSQHFHTAILLYIVRTRRVCTQIRTTYHTA